MLTPECRYGGGIYPTLQSSYLTKAPLIYVHYSTDEMCNYCEVFLSYDSSLTVTYLIPVTPEFRSEAYYIPTVGSIGLGINGIPIKGDPPSVTTAEAGIGGTGSGNIPALDHCGGHADPAGYYHWHFIPQSINTVFDAPEYNFTNLYGISCTNTYIAVSYTHLTLPTIYSV